MNEDVATGSPWVLAVSKSLWCFTSSSCFESEDETLKHPNQAELAKAPLKRGCLSGNAITRISTEE